jgi:hypothetical protein
MDATQAKQLGLKPLKKSSGPATFRFEMNEEQAQDWFKFQDEVRALGHEAGPQAIGLIALQRYVAEVRSQVAKSGKGAAT